MTARVQEAKEKTANKLTPESILARRKGKKGIWDIQRTRDAVRVLISLFLLYSGWRFYWFVRHFETQGVSPFVERPVSVEAFLPISGLVSLKVWLGTGTLDPIHPAAAIFLLAALFVAVLYKKGFCGWLCPISLISEGFARFGRRVFGKNFRLPAFIDLPLRGVKYLLLFFFIQIIVIDMPVAAAKAFINDSYNKIADVKMLYFFTELGTGMVIFFGVLFLLSMLISNFWCRYLCPYGALLGLVSMISPLKVTRREENCIDCNLCTKACPNRIDVAIARRVWSPECTSCASCVAVCPLKETLEIELPRKNSAIDRWAYPGLLLGTFFLILLIAQVTGYWQTNVTYADYMQLIPQSRYLSH